MGSIDSTVISFHFAEVAAGTDQVWYVPVPMPGTWKLEKMYFTSDTARTAHATNNTDISVENATTEIASEVTTAGDTGNLVAGTAIELAITGTGTSLEFAQGGSITLKKTDGGAGLALDGGVAFYLTNTVRN